MVYGVQIGGMFRVYRAFQDSRARFRWIESFNGRGIIGEESPACREACQADEALGSGAELLDMTYDAVDEDAARAALGE